jgi:organic radical activating enzyme
MGVFSKKPEETYLEYRDRAINPISPSFCGAKWYNATIWLGNGTTASCHHPPAHKIPLEEVAMSYKAIHNTQYKKLVRKQMLEGQRPKECEYCWKIEDLGKDKISDRVHKSVIYSEEELSQCKSLYGWEKDVDLRTLEIAFDPNCNFACSYCNASFSTTWQNDIKKNGPYQNLVSDGGGAFQHDGAHSLPYGRKNEGNPYIDAFWKWWEGELQYTLRELRVTGGEPTMSRDFWKLMKWWEQNPDCNVEFAVNSNLGQKDELFEELLRASHNIKSFHLYTSCEATEKQAEYIRDGLNWEKWIRNIDRMMGEGNVQSVNCMMTINSLCLFSITEFMDEMLNLKIKYKSQSPVCSFNILRFPSFQSIVTLPIHIRQERAKAIEDWIEKNWDDEKNGFIQWEKDSMTRLVTYIRQVESGHAFTSSLESRERDFKSFYTQYDIRRNKNFIEAFPMLKSWWDSIPETNTQPIKDLADGDDAKSNRYVEEVLSTAKKEGWILNPQKSNPGSQNYIEPDHQDEMLDYIKNNQDQNEDKAI